MRTLRLLVGAILRKTLLLSSLFASTAVDAGSKATEYPVEKFIFDAVVDHFNFRPTPTPTFPLRYFVNDDHWDETSSDTVFFYAGNEADILQFVNNSGFMFEAAQEFGALVVFAEHRYYGESLIDWDDTYQYLSVEQAIEDFNTLTVHLREQWSMPATTAIIAFGGSYGANLAMWLRLKNPNLWAGAIASSATPLKHLLRQTNSFHRIETEAYANVSQECPMLIRLGWKQLYGNMTTLQDRQHVASVLGLCNTPREAGSIHGFVSGALETMVQYGYPYPTTFYNPVPGYPFQVACKAMLVQSDEGLGALRSAMNVYYNYTGQAGSCYEDASIKTTARKHWNRMGALHMMAKQLPNVLARDAEVAYSSRFVQKRGLASVEDPADDDWGHPWSYQLCTEVFQPMPTDGITDFELPHVPNKTTYFENCQARFGVVPRPNWEEMHFMGADIFSSGSNIFLSNGQLDPWRAAGIQTRPPQESSSIIVRTIENGAHHLDLRASHPLDPASVVAVRKEERLAMHQWISEWKERHSECQNA